MASLDLNRLSNRTIKPLPGTFVSTKIISKAPVYVDLHLDLALQRTIGTGNNAKNGNDILVDVDEAAIKNSVRNLLSIRTGHKILSPWINTALEQYLFEPISNIRAEQIGQNIVDILERYEPRISISRVAVQPDIDQQTYNIELFYTIRAKPAPQSLNLTIHNGQISIQ